LGFRKLLDKINSRLVEHGYLLEAESCQQIADNEVLVETAIELETKPIADSTNNPFLNTPSRKTPRPVMSSPVRKLLQVNDGLLIPQQEFTESLKKVQKKSRERRNKRLRKSYPMS
jgi:hypothetical protein